MRLLVVEDARVMADSVARCLRREGFAVDVVYDGAAALDAASLTKYDIVILDRDLPGVHGDDVCRAICGGDTRILLLTASGSVPDRVEGLSLGADDYLTKPFDLAELVARVHALGRRPGRATAPVLRVDDLIVDPQRHTTRRSERVISLTAKEFAVLEVLASSPGVVVSAEELLDRVWDAHADPFTNTVRVTIANLRRKLGDPPLIETTIGAGYSMVDR